MKKKRWFIWLLLPLLCACQAKQSGTASLHNDNGEEITAQVVVKDKKLVEVDVDESATGKDKTKKALGSAYGLKQASAIGREWDQQIAFLEDYIVEHGMDTIEVDEAGKAVNEDVRSGCTIRIDRLLEAIKQAQKQAEQ